MTVPSFPTGPRSTLVVELFRASTDHVRAIHFDWTGHRNLVRLNVIEQWPQRCEHSHRRLAARSARSRRLGLALRLDHQQLVQLE